MKNHINGARWWKFDFHNHTPESNDYGHGSETEKNKSAKDWLLAYMAKEVDCVAITDHNTGAYIDTANEAYAELKETGHEGFRELFIFPGVELTVNSGVHLLAIFDLSKTSEDITKVIGECRYSGTYGASYNVTGETLESVIEIVNKNGGIAIPAHVDQNAGLFDKIKGPTLKRTLNNNKDNLLALEVMDKDYEFPDTYNQAKLNLAKVVGSDSHKSDEVARYFTWVKMSQPSIEALRLALHDGEDGVLRYDKIDSDPNDIAHCYFIKSLTVANGYKAGNNEPLISNFSPWLTSIIGGRGTGKSSIINYLRILFDRVKEMPAEIQDEFDKFNSVGSKHQTGMLRKTTHISAEVFKDGKLQKVHWEDQRNSLQTWNSEEQSWTEKKAITNIRELFPIQIFNQKELYTLTTSPSKLLEIIDSQFDKVAWESKKTELVSRWLAKRKEKRELEKAISEEENIKAHLIALKNKIELFESSQYKSVLTKFNEYTKISDSMESFASRSESFIRDLTEIGETLPIGIPLKEIDDKLDQVSLNYLNELKKNFDCVAAKINEALQTLEPYRNMMQSNLNDLPWHNEFLDSKKAYDDITEDIKKFGDEPYEVLIEKRNSLNDKLIQISSKKNDLKALDEELGDLYDLIMDTEKELRDKRREVLEDLKLSDKNTPMLSIELDPMADLEDAESSFRKLLRKEGKEFAPYILDVHDAGEPNKGLIANICNEPSSSRWSKRKSEIEEFLSSSEIDPKSIGKRLAKYLDSLKLDTPEDIDRLLIWVPEDQLILKYKKQGKETNIESGSAGERTAGMLGLLLSLNASPLIIDQPEDDLDTQLISDFLVTRFKELKKNKQLIVVTHNPNIAVNANSDNIVYMKYSKGQITVSANDALQDKEIRNAVCDVMEGGKTALDMRYYRISKALN